VEGSIRLIRALQIAMLAAIVIYLVVGELVSPAPRLRDPITYYVLSLVTITIVGVILVVRRTLVLHSESMLVVRPSDAPTLNRWRAGYIMTYALSEAIALFGLVLRILGFSLSQVLSFYAAGFILLLFFGPRRPRAVANSI
jgi:hypothetical protein